MKTVTKITIKRGEGPSHLCRIEHTFMTIDAAQKWLISQNHTIAETGYDKFDFIIHWGTEDSWKGTMDLHRMTDQYYKPNETDIGHHIRSYCEWMIENVGKAYISTEDAEFAQNVIKNFQLA